MEDEDEDVDVQVDRYCSDFLNLILSCVNLIYSSVSAISNIPNLEGYGVVLFVGPCKGGKTTLAYNMCHTQDLSLVVNHPGQREEFYSSSSYFLAGLHSIRVFVEHNSPKNFYLETWYNMKNRPKYFVDDGMRIIDTDICNQLLASGARIYVINVTAVKSDKTSRRQHEVHGCAKVRKDLIPQHKLVTVLDINTSTTDSYTAVTKICDILGTPTDMRGHLEQVKKTDNTIFKYECPVYENVLPNRILNRLVEYNKDCTYIKEEGECINKLLTKHRGVRVEGSSGCGVGYHKVAFDPVPAHPLVRHLIDYIYHLTKIKCNCVQISMYIFCLHLLF